MTSHVVVVGAGLAGLSAAMHLAGAGRRVTVLERAEVPGGRAGLWQPQGATGTYRFDTGPTVLTMPALLARGFEALGERMEDWLTLTRLDPAYRAFFADGSILDVSANVDSMADSIKDLMGSREAAGYRRYAHWLTELYGAVMPRFIDAHVGAPTSLLGTDLARVVAMGGFRRLDSKVRDYIGDPRLERVLTFQSMYAGVSPHRALALYGVITYMDCLAGVYAPSGGMHALPEAMAAAAAKHGVEFRYATDVTSIEHSRGRASAALTADGERVPADAVVVTADLPAAHRLLGEEPWSVRRLTYSPSCVLLLAGSTRRYGHIAHHNIHFGNAWRGVFEDLDHGRTMRDPSFLVTSPTVTDPGLAPQDRHEYYVLFPAPNVDGQIDWRRVGDRYRDELLRTLQARGYDGFADAIEVDRLTTPADWLAQGLERGAPFSAAHTFLQTGPFRPGNSWGENVVFAGSGTRPGVGVPMVVISGRLAAERILAGGRPRSRRGTR